MTKKPKPITLASEPEPQAYDVTGQVGHLLRRAYQRHMALFLQEIPDSQLTAAQFVALCAVRDMGEASLNDIVKRTAIDQATIRGVIDRLSARNLVASADHKKDARKRVVSLTADGARLVEATIPFAKRVTERTFGEFNPGEREALLFLLKKMAEME